MPPGAAPMTRADAARRDREGRSAAAAKQGPFNSHLPIGHVPIAGHIVYSLDPEWITIAQRLGGDGEDLRRVQGADGVGAAIADPVPRDQPRLAGERSRAGRHHDARSARRPARSTSAAAASSTASCSSRSRGRASRDISSAIACARGTPLWGHGVADLVIQNSYVDIKKSVIEQRRVADRRARGGSRSASRARTAARRSTPTSG